MTGREIIFYAKHNDRFILMSDSSYGKCISCQQNLSIEHGFKFKNQPVFLLIEPLEELSIQEIPKETFINGEKYVLLFAGILSETRHLTSIFNINAEL